MVQLYNINGKKIEQVIKNGKKVNLSEELSKIINKMKGRVEREIPDVGYFRDFAVNFEKGVKPDFYASDISLFVERDIHSEGEAFLGISVLHPTMLMDAKTYLVNGKRKEILEYMNKPEFKKELEETIMELSQKLKEKG